MVATYTPSGGSALNFALLVDPPERQTQQQMSERVLPGGNSIVDKIGKTVTKIRGQARFDSYAALKTFEGAVGTSGSLVYSEEPTGIPVQFVSLQRGRVTPHDIHLASVEFWIIPPTGGLTGSVPSVFRPVTVTASAGAGAFSNVLSARVSYGFDMRTGECRVVTPIKPDCTYDDELTVTMGAGGLDGTGSPITRFVGLVREFQYSNSPPSVTTIARGYLTRAAEYENGEETLVDPFTGAGGLLIQDLVGTYTGSPSDIVKAVLDKANVPYTGSNIGGSSAVYGGGISPYPFLWHSGGHIQAGQVYQVADAGESALSYIERYDTIDAEVSGTAGRYRTFETLGGVVFRIRVGGRPSSTVDKTLTGGIDIFTGQFTRSISQTRNYFVVKGQDRGEGFGPLNFALEDANDIQGDSSTGQKHTFALSSDMIERDLESSTTNTGISCETLANALSIEYNREIVTGWVETWRDDAFGIAQTHLVQGATGGLAPPLGVAERLWVQTLEISVDDRGFTQRLSYIGGGLDALSADSPDLVLLREHLAALEAAA